MKPAKKHFGQHFLVQPNIIQKIVDACQLEPNEPVVEIGPGRGALTSVLVSEAHPVVAIEIDKDLIEHLNTLFTEQNFTLISQDILTVDVASLLAEHHCKTIVGNLPYNISTPIMFHLLKAPNAIKRMIFMLQKEVVDRICAKPDSKTYGRLSVMVQQMCHAQALFDIKPSAFAPPPKVMSRILRLEPFNESNYPHIKVNCQKTFADVVRLAFCQRRKTLRNALNSVFSNEMWDQIDINPTLRAEQLSVNDFIRLANLVK